MECLKSTWKNRILKAKNCVLGLFKAFKLLKVRELRDKKIKLKSKIEEQFWNSTLLVACWRFAMVRMSDNGLGWKWG